MTFDVRQASAIAQGEVWTPPPIALEGMHVSPPSATLSSQLTGADVTTLRAACSGGRVKIFGRVRDLPAEEVTVGQSPAASQLLALGEAQWFAKVAVQHRPNGTIDVVYVPGTVALVADVARTTDAQIVAFLGLDTGGTYVICGDIRYHRSADTVIQTMVSDLRRPAYVDDGDKTGVAADQADASNLGDRFWGYLDFPLDLTEMSGIAPGSFIVDGAALPPFPFGGRVGAMQYVGGVAGAGVGADVTLRSSIDDGTASTAVTGSDLQLLLAGTAIPSTVAGGAPTAADRFAQGDLLDVEVDAVAVAFTAGSGTLRVAIFETLAR